jgi:hypothetical protein
MACNNPECHCENCTCDPCLCREDKPCGCDPNVSPVPPRVDNEWKGLI